MFFLIILILQDKQMNDSKACSTATCCRIESIVSVDERGQMVLPKEIRERAGIKAGDKLAIVGWEKEGELCCLSLFKVEQLGGMVKNLLGPLMEDLK